MKNLKKHLFYIFMVSVSLSAHSQQKTIEFTLSHPEQVVQNSLYNNIQFIEKRNNINQVHLGKISGNPVISKPGLSKQLAEFVNNATDLTAQNGTLVICLRRFAFIRRNTETGAFGGYECIIAAESYEKKGIFFSLVNKLSFSKTIDKATGLKKILETGNTAISHFLLESLSKKGCDTLINYQQLTSPDSIAKRNIAIYNNVKFIDGVYYTYQSFKNQTPDTIAIVKATKNKIKSVAFSDSLGKLNKVESSTIYALVANGKPYIATDVDYYPLQFENDEFTFNGDFSSKYDSRTAMGFYYLFGLPGVIGYALSKPVASYYVRMNYVDGKFIFLRRLDAFSQEEDELLW